MDENIRYIMASEPSPGVEPEDIREWCKEHTSVQDMIDAYVITHNKAWWVEDDVYDYEEGTEEWKRACEITDKWFGLMKEFEDKIYGMIHSEGVTIPDKGRIIVLEPFMKRYGYFDGNGWWVKIKE